MLKICKLDPAKNDSIVFFTVFVGACIAGPAYLLKFVENCPEVSHVIANELKLFQGYILTLSEGVERFLRY